MELDGDGLHYDEPPMGHLTASEGLEHRHVAEGLRHMVAASDATAAALVRAQRGHVAAIETDGSRIDPRVAADEVEQRRLAGAVGARGCPRSVPPFTDNEMSSVTLSAP